MAGHEMTLREAVHEVWNLLYGGDLTVADTQSRFRATVRALNRALRVNAMELEWSYYADTAIIGVTREGSSEVRLPRHLRPRIINDDAVRLVEPQSGDTRVWAYWLPQDALHKYRYLNELRVSHTRQKVEFSRPLTRAEAGLEIHIPVMREPRMFEVPEKTPDQIRREAHGTRISGSPFVVDGSNNQLLGANKPVPEDELESLVDFGSPDLIVLLAAVYIAEADAVLQPRVMTLQEQYTDMMYKLKEREERATDAPYVNDFELPIEAHAHTSRYATHGHPHSFDYWR